jgi:hypothetical protein
MLHSPAPLETRNDIEGAMLNLEPNISSPDDFYEALVQLHSELDDEQSAAANARLILLLANHIGDISVLKQAIQLAARNPGT